MELESNLERAEFQVGLLENELVFRTLEKRNRFQVENTTLHHNFSRRGHQVGSGGIRSLYLRIGEH